MITADLKVLESLLSINMINYNEACGGGVVVDDRTIGNGISGLSPGMDDHSLNF